ncbi:MAG: alpha-L-fucosidase, partial [Clostridiales bacterium]|nr:alpha-L-fucosidase [Clostridiales bacterium]
MSRLPFRQVHLDFHTSEKIPGIGSAYNEEDFINTLKTGHVNSITVFAKCHHGWSYYPSKVNPIHPNLKFDLLSAQLKACKKAGIRAPIYISAGYDEKEAVKHPEWIVKPNPDFNPDFSFPHYQLLCMNSPYLNLLIEQVEEVMQLFNPDEIFLDICGERRCYCENCIKGMKEAGLDPESEEDHDKYSIFVYAEYCRKVREAVDKYNSETAVFHNGGNIIRGRRDLVSYESHLELESLPTGGWGYDHFPMSAAYCRNLGKEYLGMTGKFHVSWGEFGGFKHPNALIYETSLSLALGAKCSIGDQLHPCGELNSATYNLIGKAYKLVEEKEPWCDDVSSIADIA